MADVFDAETRSRIMRAIRSRDTKPELALAAALRRAKPAHVSVSRRRKTGLPGSPDLLLRHARTGARLAVFVHGCFWHLCRLHYRPPSGEGWLRKMDANRRRDIRVRRQLRARRWPTMVVWEHEDPARAVSRVLGRIEALRG